MAFLEKVQIALEVTGASGAAKELGNLANNVEQADTKTGKLKAGVGGLANTFMAAATSPAGLAAGVGAAVAVGLKAVGQFEDLGVSIGKFSDATGLSTEESSRWVEVANDAGVSTEALQGTFGKLEKAAGNTPQLFADLGIEIAKTKDGQVDANQTFLNAIDVINGIEDPNKKAAAATKIFGKSWQDMSELIARGSPQLKQDLASVQPSKIYTDKDVKSARAVRDGFDAIKDAGEGLMLTLGRALAPAIAAIAPKIGELITKLEPAMEAIGEGFANAAEAAGPLLDAVGAITDAIGALGKVKIKMPDGSDFSVFTEGAIGYFQAIVKVLDAQHFFGEDKGFENFVHNAGQAAHDAANATDVYTQSNTDLALSYGLGTTGANAYAVSAEEAEQATKDAAAATAAHTQSLKDEVKALEDSKKAEEDLIDAHKRAADAQYNLDAAIVANNETLANYDEDMKATNGDAAKQKVVLDGVAKSAQNVADAWVEAADQQAQAKGETISHTQKIDIQNNSLLSQAAALNGPQRQAIVDHIALINGIPPDVETQIQAALDRGDIDEANRLLNTTSQTRTAAVRADADEASINATNAALNGIAKTRTVTYQTRYDDSGGMARGGAHAGGGYTGLNEDESLVGEYGPEIVRLPPHSQVTPADRTASRMNKSSAANVTNVSIYTSAGMNPSDIAAAIRRHERRNGR